MAVANHYFNRYWGEGVKSTTWSTCCCKSYNNGKFIVSMTTQIQNVDFLVSHPCSAFCWWTLKITGRIICHYCFNLGIPTKRNVTRNWTVKVLRKQLRRAPVRNVVSFILPAPTLAWGQERGFVIARPFFIAFLFARIQAHCWTNNLAVGIGGTANSYKCR